jgi:hypothetical protein
VIRLRLVRTVPWVVCVALWLGLTFTCLFLYRTVHIECARGNGGEGECVVRQTSLLGGTDERHLPGGSIRGADIKLSTTLRSGPSPAHTDTTLVLALTDGSFAAFDDGATWLDHSFDASDRDAINAFLSKKTAFAAVSAGGVVTGLVVFVTVSALLALAAVTWGMGALVIRTDGTELKIEGPDESSSHPLAGIREIVVDKAYGSLRVRYTDGSDVQTAKLGVGVGQLEGVAVKVRGLIGQA